MSPCGTQGQHSDISEVFGHVSTRVRKLLFFQANGRILVFFAPKTTLRGPRNSHHLHFDNCDKNFLTCMLDDDLSVRNESLKR